MLILLLRLDLYPADGKIRIFESLSFHSEILGQELRFSVCLPEDYYTSKTSYPVVYLLHGLGDDESSWLEYGRISQMADRLTEEGETVPMIFVMPQGFRCYYSNDEEGKFRYQDMFTEELIPYIDRHYRTIPDRRHRATAGYSMGGFGALILPLRHPDLIATCVALSISIRTDAQYMEEYAPEWDKQWGSIFGGAEKTGIDRITEYYKENCPFHLFLKEDLTPYKDLNIFIDNGDDEQTLCRSNEELHILMRDRGIPHEFRVRNGGHEFSYWRDAMVNGLRYISDAFSGLPYRGDLQESTGIHKRGPAVTKKMQVEGLDCTVVLPEEYSQTDRKYPVIYLAGSYGKEGMERIGALTRQMTADGDLPPLIMVFLPDPDALNRSSLFESMEKELRIREGFRFRSVIGSEEGGSSALKLGLLPGTVSSCILLNARLPEGVTEKALSGLDTHSLERTWYYVAMPENSPAYRENGMLHMAFRDRQIYHEYRVSEGEGGEDWMLARLPQALLFIAKKFHN